MRRGKPLRRTEFKGPRKQIKQISDKRKAHWESDEGKVELEYMGDVKQLPCAICRAPPPCDAHHCVHDRYGSAKKSGFNCIPLCKFHHQDSPEAIHNGKETWREKHGPDHGYIKETRKAVERMRKQRI